MQSDLERRGAAERLTWVEAVSEQRHLENQRRLTAIEDTLRTLQRYLIVGLGSSITSLAAIIIHFLLAKSA